MADVLNPMPGMEVAVDADMPSAKVEITVQGDDLPAGGNAGDVLTKTENGAEWKGISAAAGGYYTPSVSENGDLSWTPSSTDMPSVAAANVRGPAGPRGDTGDTGPQGQRGDTGAAGGYYTPNVSETGDLSWTASKSDMPAVEPVNIKGPQGEKGDPGSDATVTNQNITSALGYTPADKVVVDQLSEENEGLKDDLADKLPKSPTDWQEWTAEEQAAARVRIGEFTDSPLTTVADVTLDETASFINVQLEKQCRFVTCTFVIPPESSGQNRNIYFANNVASANNTDMFARSLPASTSSTNYAFYFVSALIIGGKILSFGCMSGAGTSIADHQTRTLNNPPNGFCVLDAEYFEKIAVYTYGEAFPAGSRLVVTGC